MHPVNYKENLYFIIYFIPRNGVKPGSAKALCGSAKGSRGSAKASHGLGVLHEGQSNTRIMRPWLQSSLFE